MQSECNACLHLRTLRAARVRRGAELRRGEDACEGRTESDVRRASGPGLSKSKQPGSGRGQRERDRRGQGADWTAQTRWAAVSAAKRRACACVRDGPFADRWTHGWAGMGSVESENWARTWTCARRRWPLAAADKGRRSRAGASACPETRRRREQTADGRAARGPIAGAVRHAGTLNGSSRMCDGPAGEHTGATRFCVCTTASTRPLGGRVWDTDGSPRKRLVCAAAERNRIPRAGGKDWLNRGWHVEIVH